MNCSHGSFENDQSYDSRSLTFLESFNKDFYGVGAFRIIRNSTYLLNANSKETSTAHLQLLRLDIAKIFCHMDFRKEFIKINVPAKYHSCSDADEIGPPIQATSNQMLK
jgi:hypothetical protein